MMLRESNYLGKNSLYLELQRGKKVQYLLLVLALVWSPLTLEEKRIPVPYQLNQIIS